MMADGESERNGDNPFSFSKFLEKNDTVVFPETVPLFQDNGATNDVEANPFSIKNFEKSVTKKNTKKLQIVEDSKLPEPPVYSPPLNTVKDDTNSDSDNDIFDDRTPSPQMDSYILPDTVSQNEEMFLKIKQLTHENKELQNDLKNLKEEFLEYRQTANRRITGLQKELEKARKKEADETKTLEDVVHMVEENLQATTTRAVKAESTVALLKEELKSYKEGSVSLFEYQQLITDHNRLLNTIQEKSKNAASLMKTAAEKTEPHIRQLQSGIASLYFLSEQFDEIGKIAELPVADQYNNDDDNHIT